MTTTFKPYRLTIVKREGQSIKEYDRKFSYLDVAYKAIEKMIDKCNFYCFKENRIVLNGSVTCTLYNEVMPCYIPISFLFESSLCDHKCI